MVEAGFPRYFSIYTIGNLSKIGLERGLHWVFRLRRVSHTIAEIDKVNLPNRVQRPCTACSALLSRLQLQVELPVPTRFSTRVNPKPAMLESMNHAQ